MSQILWKTQSKSTKSPKHWEKTNNLEMPDGVEYMVALTHKQLLKGSEEGVGP